MIYWKNVKIKIRTSVILENLIVQLNKGESLGIIGANGSGKTILSKAIAGLLPILGEFDVPSNKIKRLFISFQSEIKLKHGGRGYRQQRWNLPDPEFVPTVIEEFKKIEDRKELERLIQKFDFEDQLNRFVISLSNGEQRKFELIKALSQKPDLLVIDNVFNGLDVHSRELLNEMLDQLISEGHSIVLTGVEPDIFPESLTNLMMLENRTGQRVNRSVIKPLTYQPLKIETVLPQWHNSNYKEIIKLNQVDLHYGEKTILKNISWKVKAGEHWVLSGANGSGKTSLLNLIFGDNPKAYLCDIYLFGKKKGSGESIWDIKRRIGFVSPEMHQYVSGRQTVNDVVCSGFFDSEGLYIKPTSYQRNLAARWLELANLRILNEALFETLSASAQRMVLILRALVNNPPLLILDEPFQGFDRHNIQLMKNLLTLIAQNTNCTMIFVSHFRDEIPPAFTLELQLKKGETEFLGKRK